jgi:hypothetical protein
MVKIEIVEFPDFGEQGLLSAILRPAVYDKC